MKAATHILAALIGAALCYWAMSSRTVPLGEFQAVSEAHAKAEAKALDYRAQSAENAALARRAQGSADSLRQVRKIVRTVVIASPDSVALELGLNLTAPDSLTRCLPAAELAQLLAARVELGLADSAAAHDMAATAACFDALALSDSAGAIHREDATRLHGAAQGLAEEVQANRRTRWFWAAVGAALALLAVFGAGAL